jgi:hypothetical protein
MGRAQRANTNPNKGKPKPEKIYSKKASLIDDYSDPAATFATLATLGAMAKNWLCFMKGVSHETRSS